MALLLFHHHQQTTQRCANKKKGLGTHALFRSCSTGKTSSIQPTATELPSTTSAEGTGGRLHTNNGAAKQKGAEWARHQEQSVGTNGCAPTAPKDSLFAVALPHSAQAHASLGLLSKWSRLSHLSAPAAPTHAAGSGALHARQATRRGRDILPAPLC